MKKNTKLIILITFASLVLGCFLQPRSAQALEQCEIKGNKGANVDLNRVAECMENRYGFDRNSMRRNEMKKEVPTVDIHFDNTDPKEGQKVTAIASVKGFKNSSESLYYTWYLIHTNPDTGSHTNSIADGKQEAMGIIARGKYDYRLFGDSPGGDDDGYQASYGGDDGVGAKAGDSQGDFFDGDNPPGEI